MIFLLLKGPRVTGFGTRELRPETRFQPRLPSENQPAPCAPAARHPRERSDSVRRAASPAPARGAGAERGAASHAPREGDVISGSGSEDGLRGSRKRQGPRALAAAGRRAGLRPGPSARPGPSTHPRALRAPRGPLERRVSFLASVAFPMWHTGPTCACPSARSDTGGRHTANPPPRASSLGAQQGTPDRPADGATGFPFEACGGRACAGTRGPEGWAG